MDVGVEIDHYIIVEHIGRGGMADVWSARDRRLNRTVAIKTIARDLSAEEDIDPVELFKREAQTIAQIEHPHILPIYDFGEYTSQLYIVMRYVTGGSLEQLVADGPMGLVEALPMIRAVGQALDHAHASKVVHLDIKPSNILLDSNQSPYLADFGLATVLGPEGRAANPGYGTLLYMAPEQLTQVVLDHRADIYSFTILVFHMLTGELPFDATTSLALKQLQYQEDLPDMGGVRPHLPAGLTQVLRRGTALDPDVRPNSVMELVRDIEAILQPSSVRVSEPTLLLFPDAEKAEVDSQQIGGTVDLSDVMPMVSADELARREAVDLYTRARRAWAHGQGRFLLGITHFMLINDYYMKAEELGLELDEAGMQMLLRGALEYDHEVVYWWSRLDEVNQRWVTLHAIRSDNAPARERALYRLETLPDSDPPRIPALVAQALQVEQNEAAKRAAVHVLATRAQIRTHYDITSEFKGSLLTTRARQLIQLRAPEQWRATVYNEEIDTLLAEIALDRTYPAVAEQAARTIGRIRSMMAVQNLAEAQRAGKRGALRALALVRDETAGLPSVVSPAAQFYAWVANTWRRISDQPMGVVWRYIFAALGGFLALAGYAWVNLPNQAIFQASSSGIAVSTGLTFAFFTGFLALIAGEFPARLDGFWSWAARLLTGGVLGTLWGALTWGAFTWFFLNYPPETSVMLMGGLGLALGYVLAQAFRLPGWLAFVLTAVCIYASIYAASANYMPPILYFRNPENQMIEALAPTLYSQGAWVALTIALGGHAQALWRDVQRVWGAIRSRF